MFADDEHKFTVHEHTFMDGEHKFMKHEYKIVNCMTNFVLRDFLDELTCINPQKVLHGLCP